MLVTSITVSENESFESALRRFNKKVQGDAVLSECRRSTIVSKSYRIVWNP